MRRAFTTLAVLPLIFTSSCGMFDAKIVTACEDVIKERLRSPSNYQRVSINREEKVLTKTDYFNYLYANVASSPIREAKNQQFERGELKPVTYSLTINYDAPNAYNAPIRSRSTCEYTNEQGTDAGASEVTVIVDGKDQITYLTDSLKAIKTN